MQSVIQIQNLHRHHHQANGVIKAVDGVDLNIEEGEFIAIIGPSGSGKSTLLSLIAGLDQPTDGEIWIAGVPLHKKSEEEKVKLRREKIGFVFQSFQLFDNYTALENVQLPLEMNGMPEIYAQELLTEVGLGDRYHHYPAQLSGGEQQRVAIARAFAIRPPILLADEPTGNLDQENGDKVMAIIQTLRHQYKTTFVVVTHDPSIAQQADRIYQMKNGRIAE